MKFGLIALFTALMPLNIAAWSPEDHEIFRLRDDVIAQEGPDATFYSLVGVQRKATADEIKRTYRKKASRIHPDKARHSFIANYGKVEGEEKKSTKKPSEREIAAFHKDANSRFERLSVIASVLTGAQRDRYDYFLDHGFPKWRGTGYYYQRYRPGAATVLVGLFIVLGGFAHYGAMILSYNRQRAFAEKYIKAARKLAWGNNLVVPGLDTATSTAAANGNESSENSALNRRQKRMQEKENRKSSKKPVMPDDISPPQDAQLVSGPQGTKRKVTAENGKTLIVDSVGNVFVEETNEEGETHEFFIDVSV
jgi:DnaJ-class molecular chaperone